MNPGSALIYTASRPVLAPRVRRGSAPQSLARVCAHARGLRTPSVAGTEQRSAPRVGRRMLRHPSGATPESRSLRGHAGLLGGLPPGVTGVAPAGCRWADPIHDPWWRRVARARVPVRLWKGAHHVPPVRTGCAPFLARARATVRTAAAGGAGGLAVAQRPFVEGCAAGGVSARHRKVVRARVPAPAAAASAEARDFAGLVRVCLVGRFDLDELAADLKTLLA